MHNSLLEGNHVHEFSKIMSVSDAIIKPILQCTMFFALKINLDCEVTKGDCMGERETCETVDLKYAMITRCGCDKGYGRKRPWEACSGKLLNHTDLLRV